MHDDPRSVESGALQLRLSSESGASRDDVAEITDALDQWNMDTTGVHDYVQVAIFVRDDDGEIRGGVTGGVWGTWLHITGLWVDEDLRGRGFGRELILAAEREARNAGATRAFLETHSFQAPDLYRKLGYVEFAEIEDYPPGESQLFLRRNLVDRVVDSEPSAELGSEAIRQSSR